MYGEDAPHKGVSDTTGKSLPKRCTACCVTKYRNRARRRQRNNIKGYFSWQGEKTGKNKGEFLDIPRKYGKKQGKYGKKQAF